MADDHLFAEKREADQTRSGRTLVHGVVVDTAWFTGNYPPQISVEAAYVEGHPPAEELLDKTQWTTIVERSDITGNTRNPFGVNSSERWSHVRLSIYPDGGVARLRPARWVKGERHRVAVTPETTGCKCIW